MTVSDQKRMAKACRTCGALLRYYPVSFRQDYGEILSLHFRDEYRSALASGGHFPLLGFWVFILFDFLRSLMMEVQEEVAKMFKKNFFVYCAIAAGIVTLLQFPISSPYVFTNDKVDMWGQLLFWPLFLGCTSLTLFGIAKGTGSHVIFRIMALLVLVSAATTLPIPSRDTTYGWVGRPAFTYLFINEDRIFGYFLTAYLLLSIIISVVALIKKKWLPGVCLLAMNLTLLIPNVAYSLLKESPFVDIVLDSNWYPLFIASLYAAAWFVIAWWLQREAVPEQTLQTA